MKILLVPSLIAAAGLSANGAAIHAGLLNYWNFDNNLADSAGSLSGNVSAVSDDGSFAGANGTDGIAFGAGRFGAGITQNGAGGGAAGQENDGYVMVTRSADTLAGDTSTISTSFWVQTAGVDTGWQTMLAHGEGSQYRFARRGGDVPVIAAYAGGSGDIPGAGVGPDIGAATGWHHIVGISEGGVSTRLWVDGVLIATGGAPTINDNGNNNPPSPDLFIGANPQTGANNREWWGDIDDVAQWDRVITDAEIGLIYSAGQNGIPLGAIPEPGVVSLFGLATGVLLLRRRR